MNVQSIKEPTKKLLLFNAILFLYILANSLFNNGFHLSIKYFPIVFMPILAMPIKRGIDKRTNYFRYLKYGLIITLFLGAIRFLVSDNKEISYENIELFLNVHPTYFSLFALIYINHCLFTMKRAVFSKLTRFAYVSFLILVVLLIRSRIAVIALVCLITYWFYFGLQIRKRYLVLFFLIGVATSFIIVNSNIKGKTTFSLALTERFQIWESSIDLILEKPVFGYGVDNELDQLSKDFFNKAKLNLMDERYNSHNSYLSTTIQLGALGLSLGFFSMISPVAFLKSKEEYMGFLLICGICALTESFIHRHWGVILVLIAAVYVHKYSFSNN